MKKLMSKVSLVITILAFFIGACSSPKSGPTAQVSGNRASLTSISISSNPGALGFYKYVPNNLPSNSPLVVVLHGCAQSASEYAHDTGWNTLADKFKFAVVYAEQSASNNSTRCFNWFEPGDINRGQGEAKSIINSVDKMIADHNLDTNRVYVTGLSAGGAMTTVMAAAYPDRFAGAAAMAGIPYKCATSMTDGFSCMNGTNKTPQQWGDLVRNAYSSFSGTYPKMAVFQGSSDTTVDPLNATEIVEQWNNVHGADQTADFQETINGHSRKVYNNAAGEPVVELFIINGMTHGISVDPGTGEKQGGLTGSYAFDKDLYSSYYAAKFWGLDNTDTEAPSVSVTSPANGTQVTGTVSITATATDNVGVEKVEFYINGVLKGTDTTAPYSYSWNAGSVYNGEYALTAKAYDAAGSNAESSVSVTVIGGATDSNAPTGVAVTSPSAGSTINKTITITASASDAETGIAKVEFFVDGALKGTATTSPYSIELDTTQLTDGAHSLTVKATDGAGNATTSAAVSVTVTQIVVCHTETATDTVNNHYLAGRLDLNGLNTYGAKYGYVDTFKLFHLDVANGGNWVDVDALPAGCDSEGEPTNPTDTAPTVSITAPIADVEAGVITISADASDDNGVTKVEFYVNDVKVGEDTSAPYSISYTAAAGTLNIKAVATDTASQQTTSSIVTITITEPGTTCDEYTASNYTHVSAGRATQSLGYTYAKGSGENMGLYNFYTTTTLYTNDDGATFKIGSCD